MNDITKHDELIDRAEYYVLALAPHVREREAARIIVDLLAELKRKNELIEELEDDQPNCYPPEMIKGLQEQASKVMSKMAEKFVAKVRRSGSGPES